MKIKRRQVLRDMGLFAGAVVSTASLSGSGIIQDKNELEKPSAKNPKIRITRVKAILTAPNKPRLVVVKVETSEPGLYGLGCATFTQRATLVTAAVNEYINEFAKGRDPDNIEDIWQGAYTSAYWRNGPVLNNTLSGLDMALWDIKGKRAGMPLHQLFGGKCRFALDTYVHAFGPNFETIEKRVKGYMEKGFRNVRIQYGGYGGQFMKGKRNPDYEDAGFGLGGARNVDPPIYVKEIPKMFEYVRETCGEKIELLHDIHSRLDPHQAIQLIKDLEPYRPFFIEDPFTPEHVGYYDLLRKKTTVPIAMGELFNHPLEWKDLITNRLIDFIRVHVSQIGGLTPARKLAALAEYFNVRTAWHGPGDVSPVGHAAHAHLDFAIPNFGIQEASFFNQKLQDIFPGCPTFKNGYMHLNDAPGIGVDIDEELAKKFPATNEPDNWMRPVRKPDGSIVRP